MPPAATKSKYGKNLQVLHFDPAQLKGHEMPVKCEQPLDELKVQVWLLYDHPNFKYCTLFVSGTELCTDRQTDRQTNDPNTRCRGHKNIRNLKLCIRVHCADMRGYNLLPINRAMYYSLHSSCTYTGRGNMFWKRGWLGQSQEKERSMHWYQDPLDPRRNLHAHR